MKINCLLEGGLGDLVLASRFIAAVKEVYPDANIGAFINNDQNMKFNMFFNEHWGYLYNRFYPDVKRAAQSYKIQSQLGEENYPAAFSNITQEWKNEILDCDKFYNFHLDSLEFTQYSDIPWMKYLNFIPRPRNMPALRKQSKPFIAVNLFARANHFSGLTKEQSENIISGLRDISEVVVVAPSQEAKDTFYEKNKDITIVTSLEDNLRIASEATLGVSIDSGFRCLFYPFGKACFTLCGLCNKPFTIPDSHKLRWYMWPEHILPININASYLCSIVEGAINSPINQLITNVPSGQVDNHVLRRIYA